MPDIKDMAAALSDLVDAMHLQAKELERLTSHIERQTGPLPKPLQMSLVLSGLSELQVRLRSLIVAEEKESASAEWAPYLPP